MKWAITNPSGARVAVQAGEYEPKPSCTSWVVDAPPLDRFERIDIYGSAFFMRLRDYLHSIFPKSQEVFERLSLGDVFDKLVAEYIVSVPSSTPNIDTFGLAFVDFCRQDSSTPIENVALYGLLELESSVLRAHLIACTPQRVLEKIPLLDASSLETARFITDSTLSLLESTADLVALWRDPTHAPTSPSHKTWCAVWRDLSGGTRVEPLKENAFQFLTALHSGLPLHAITTKAEGTQTQQWFQEWVENGIIRDIAIIH
ncbi:MAG: putative DNA-binding domain-containing protein [Bdellovibrionales bacterium]|nr:putative DNA-binding domain-containing protein [Bdellovibrionales bacterium]